MEPFAGLLQGLLGAALAAAAEQPVADAGADVVPGEDAALAAAAAGRAAADAAAALQLCARGLALVQWQASITPGLRCCSQFH